MATLGYDTGWDDPSTAYGGSNTTQAKSSSGLGSQIWNALGGLGTSLSSGSTSGGTNLAGIGGSLGSIFGPVGTTVGSLLGQVGSLFTKSPEGKAKEVATDYQMMFMKDMAAIRDRVKSGELDPYQAIEAINNMLASAQSGAVTDQKKAAMGIIASQASNVINEIRAVGTEQMNKPYTAGENLTGGETSQRSRGRALMRNMLMGTESGNNFAASTPAGQLIAPRDKPEDLYAKYYKPSEQTLKLSSQGNNTSALGDRIMGTLNKLGGY